MIDENLKASSFSTTPLFHKEQDSPEKKPNRKTLEQKGRQFYILIIFITFTRLDKKTYNLDDL